MIFFAVLTGVSSILLLVSVERFNSVVPLGLTSGGFFCGFPFCLTPGVLVAFRRGVFSADRVVSLPGFAWLLLLGGHVLDLLRSHLGFSPESPQGGSFEVVPKTSFLWEVPHGVFLCGLSGLQQRSPLKFADLGGVVLEGLLDESYAG